MLGVTVGENLIIGTFSLVHEDIHDNVIAIEVPAKLRTKSRDYSDATD